MLACVLALGDAAGGYSDVGTLRGLMELSKNINITTEQAKVCTS